MRGDDKGARMANAMAVVAGRAARPCDVCARKRSRWYCAADEAYLCEGCDSSVHAANALALRHERVRLGPDGRPMKIERRINNSENPSAGKKKVKGRVTSASYGKYVSDHTHSNNNGLVREVKEECFQGDNASTEIDPSDDHFTAEELTGNANLLDDTSVCARYDNSSCNRASGTESDFARFLVSDPNDPNNCTDWGTDTDGMRRGIPTGATSPDVVDSDVCNGAGGEWMHLDSDFANQDSTLSDSDDYCIDSVALRGSAAASNGAFDQSLPLYSHDEKPRLPTASARTEKQLKNGHPEWVKQEEPGFPNYQQDLPINPTSISSVKLELSKCDPTQTPSLRLNYADILSLWPDREIHLPKDDNGPQLVPRDDSNSDGIGHRYEVGLVPDLTSAPYGLDAHGNPTTMYGGCGAGSMGSGGGVAGGDDSMANSGNARELRVNRYREKRRTRLFSKKIRYEVRKLNAERRPRMKGRFVKRSPGREA